MITTISHESGLSQYSNGDMKFILGDNMQYLRWCKEQMMFKHFHFAIVDPPYGISVGDMKLGAKSTQAHKEKKFETGAWDNEVPTQEYWDLLWYCCQNVIAWGGNYFLNEWGRVADNHGRITGMPSGRCFLFWDKKKYDLDFADGELALTTLDANARSIMKARNGKEDEFEGDKRHPTQKPIYVYDFIYTNYVKRGSRVLDTHGGSMSHAVAAHRNGCKLTILEANESYFQSGIENFLKSTVKARLF